MPKVSNSHKSVIFASWAYIKTIRNVESSFRLDWTLVFPINVQPSNVSKAMALHLSSFHLPVINFPAMFAPIKTAMGSFLLLTVNFIPCCCSSCIQRSLFTDEMFCRMISWLRVTKLQEYESSRLFIEILYPLCICSLDFVPPNNMCTTCYYYLCYYRNDVLLQIFYICT